MHQRGLAGAIVSNESDTFARADVKIDARQGADSAKALGDVHKIDDPLFSDGHVPDSSQRPVYGLFARHDFLCIFE